MDADTQVRVNQLLASFAPGQIHPGPVYGEEEGGEVDDADSNPKTTTESRLPARVGRLGAAEPLSARVQRHPEDDLTGCAALANEGGGQDNARPYEYRNQRPHDSSSMAMRVGASTPRAGKIRSRRSPMIHGPKPVRTTTVPEAGTMVTPCPMKPDSSKTGEGAP